MVRFFCDVICGCRYVGKSELVDCVVGLRVRGQCCEFSMAGVREVM